MGEGVDCGGWEEVGEVEDGGARGGVGAQAGGEVRGGGWSGGVDVFEDAVEGVGGEDVECVNHRGHIGVRRTSGSRYVSHRKCGQILPALSAFTPPISCRQTPALSLPVLTNSLASTMSWKSKLPWNKQDDDFSRPNAEFEDCVECRVLGRFCPTLAPRLN